jgi:DNA polymerase III subunit epsilon
MTDRRSLVVERVARFMKDGCVIIDLETTGFVHPEVDIVEIAVIDHKGEVLMNTLVRPTKPIPSAASAVHGIFASDVKDAPLFCDIYPDLLRCIEGLPVVAYNYTFEKGIFEAVCSRYRQQALTCEWSCAMRDYAGYKRLHRPCKLTDACFYENIPVKDAHRALGDCLMTLQLMRKMASSYQ